MMSNLFTDRIATKRREFTSKQASRTRISATVTIKLFIPAAAIISAGVDVGQGGARFTPRRSGDVTFDIDFTAAKAKRSMPAAVRVGAFAEHIVEIS